MVQIFLSINMNGWLGRDMLRCETYSEGSSILYAILAQDWGFPRIFFAMPTIHRTDLAAWRVVARRWRRGNRGRDASLLSREERLASLAARGAFIEAQWDAVFRAPDLQADWCRTCAQWTTSWCEGCYSRCQPADEFSAICHACDGEHHVCDRCEAVAAGASALRGGEWRGPREPGPHPRVWNPNRCPVLP